MQHDTLSQLAKTTCFHIVGLKTTSAHFSIVAFPSLPQLSHLCSYLTHFAKKPLNVHTSCLMPSGEESETNPLPQQHFGLQVATLKQSVVQDLTFTLLF